MQKKAGQAVFSNIFAGCVCSLMTVIASISYATLIFSGVNSPIMRTAKPGPGKGCL